MQPDILLRTSLQQILPLDAKFNFYAIGVADPTSILVNTYGTGKVSDEKLSNIISKVFDLTPYGIIKSLNLLEVKFKPTAGFGHFGEK